MFPKLKTPFFDDPPAGYYLGLACLCGVSLALLLYMSVLCIAGRTYWPVILFAITAFFLVGGIRGFLRSARRKRNPSRANQPPLPTPGKCPPSTHDQLPGAADL
jgi:hypothetical protein